MADEKDRFGETMKLAERAKEDIYFAEHDRELIEKLRRNCRRPTSRSRNFTAPNAQDC
jgi:hypothetical protein